MRNITRLCGAVALTGASLLGPGAHGEEAGRLPEDWFVLPEDQASYEAQQLAAGEVEGLEARGATTYRRGLDPVSRSLDRVLVASFEALDSSTLMAGERQPPPNAPTDWAPWHLKEVIMDLGVSASGTVGVVTAKGEISAEVYYKPTTERLRELGVMSGTEAYDDKPADLQVTSGMTRVQIVDRLEPIVDAVMATGRVESRSRVEEGLLKVASELQDVMTNVNGYQGAWDVERFRIDVTVEGSGSVGVGMTAGLGVRLRFEWVESGEAVRPELENDDPKRASFRTLMASLSRDLESIQADDYQASGFALTKVRLGVGLYGQAKFGLIKGKIEGMGYVFLKQPTQPREHTHEARIVLPDEIPLLDEAPPAEHLRYATAQGVRHEVVSDDGGSGADKVVYFMSRERFRQGLAKAASMGGFFATRAANATSSNWSVYKVKPQFALSLQGATPLVTIGGKVSLEMELKR